MNDREKIRIDIAIRLSDFKGLDWNWSSTQQSCLMEADQIIALFDETGKIECVFEDWDDTTLPHPVCHCLKRDGVDCANVPDDVEACPDFMDKRDWGIEEAKKQERERIHIWSGEKCTEHDGNTLMNSIRRGDCPKCWQSLKNIDTT